MGDSSEVSRGNEVFVAGALAQVSRSRWGCFAWTYRDRLKGAWSLNFDFEVRRQDNRRLRIVAKYSFIQMEIVHMGPRLVRYMSQVSQLHSSARYTRAKVIPAHCTHPVTSQKAGPL